MYRMSWVSDYNTGPDYKPGGLHISADTIDVPTVSGIIRYLLLTNLFRLFYSVK